MTRFDGINFGDSRHDGLGADAGSGELIQAEHILAASGSTSVSSITGTASLVQDEQVLAASGPGSALPMWGGIDDGDTRHVGLGGVPESNSGALVQAEQQLSAVGTVSSGVLSVGVIREPNYEKDEWFIPLKVQKQPLSEDEELIMVIGMFVKVQEAMWDHSQAA